ncbi:copper resistance protein CopC [Metabacillus sp. GX 13764]|uniref:copper resistance CopC family protein n=1 Tax=Metabacillus kandeliae TaxID=2900151 RepID=UPI001E31F3ED|nr:copper resistance CopC family protein [Metabacillus kandeliae]MCD7034198.1 copper resistance protein CopC [Metabacillus kandeliae]
MKKTASIVFLLLLLFLSVASAHSKLVDSNPKAGATVTGELSQIQLTFNTPVEETSKISLSDGKNDIPVTDQKIDGSKLSGSIPKDLKNGTYQLSWDIIGEDSHNVKDSISFTIDRKEQAQAPKQEEKAPAAEKKTQQHEHTEKPAPEKTGNAQSATPWVIGGILVILAVIVIALTRRK